MKKIVIVVLLIGCAAIPIPIKDQIKTGIGVACVILQSTGCFDRIQGTLPGVSSSTCTSLIGTILDLAFMSREQRGQIKALGIEQSKINFDAIRISELQSDTGQTCEQVGTALGITVKEQ
jgi:hypothetical protein